MVGKSCAAAANDELYVALDPGDDDLRPTVETCPSFFFIIELSIIINFSNNGKLLAPTFTVF